MSHETAKQKNEKCGFSTTKKNIVCQVGENAETAATVKIASTPTSGA